MSLYLDVEGLFDVPSSRIRTNTASFLVLEFVGQVQGKLQALFQYLVGK